MVRPVAWIKRQFKAKHDISNLVVLFLHRRQSQQTGIMLEGDELTMSTKGPFAKLRSLNFVGRTPEVDAFVRALDSVQRHDEHRIINWFAPDGYGKSTLRRKLEEHVEKSKAASICALDFEHDRHRSHVEWLLRIRERFGKDKRIDFSTFDFVFARYFALTRPDEDVREAYPRIFANGSSPIVEDLFSWADEGLGVLIGGASTILPGLNLLYKYGSRLKGALADWWRTKSVKEQLEGIDDVEVAELENALPSILAYDIQRSQTKKDRPRIVLFLDAYEVVSGSGRMIARNPYDSWFRNLVELLPGCLVVIFGRLYI
ncbi:hypothetical protein [uncultured Tateyamaria sp.]|uniref:hypothetical protein n=1 Tax=uncultured Tateyamaria sp. TaxID=455651 RepID=UPI0026149714|nr:hypothetical protein [uncultured Tateyamaria sp.]